MSRDWTKTIKSWDYGTVTVGTLRPTSYAVSNSCQFSETASTILNLHSHAQTVWNYSTPPASVLSAFSVDRDVTYDWTTDITSINNYIYWIWGGVGSGGVGLIKHSNGTLSFVVSHGYYLNYSTHKGKYYLTYHCGVNYSNVLDFSQVAFAYFNNSARTASYINPFPADNYLQNICILIRNGTPNQTTQQYPWIYWNLANDGSRVSPYYYDPEPNNTNSFQTNDLNTLFDASWTYAESISGNYKRYYPNRCFTLWTYTVPSVNNACLFMDDEHWGVSGYSHESGNWFGTEEDNEGGDGDGDNSQGGSTPMHVDDIPSDVTDTGFVRLYKSAPVDLRALANFMFATLTTNQADVLKKLLSNPLDYIICLNACHFDVTADDYENIKMGGIDTTVQSRPTKQFVHLSGGSYTIEHYWGSYLDYAPFTTIQIHVPYCGTHTLDTDMVMDSTLTLDYEIDLLSGTMVAQLSISKPNDLKNQPDSIDGKVIETYTGNVFTQIPIANTDYRQMITSVLGIASSAVTSVASNNPLPLANGVANAVTNSKSTVTKNGSISNNYGYMSHQNAFLIISRPCLTMSGDEQTKFHDWMGYPCNMVKKVGDFSGVLTIQKGTFWNGDNSNPFTSITDTEKDEIAQLLENGICV